MKGWRNDMVKFIGSIMITAAAAMIGFLKVKSLSEHVKALNAVISALEVMRAEILFRLTPLPEIMSQLSRNSDDPISCFFESCAEKLKTETSKPFTAIWNEALSEHPELPFSQEERTVLADLGTVLGRYDPEQQAKAIGLAESRLDRFLKKAEAVRATQGRMYGALGVIIGICIVIVLL